MPQFWTVQNYYKKPTFTSQFVATIPQFVKYPKKKAAERAVRYPITTSSTIISTNPRAKPMVLRLLCSPLDASGISSSITT